MQFKADVIRKVVEERLTKEQAAKLLQWSVRMIGRYIAAYQKEGVTFVAHKNIGRVPVNRCSDKLKKKARKLLQTKYFDFNLTHLKEKLESSENIFVKKEPLIGSYGQNSIIDDFTILIGSAKETRMDNRFYCYP